ncbi:MAG: YncE family protein [Desulfamplus sp.]|nr:YncE family protein [Desulfamplus sp.]
MHRVTLLYVIGFMLSMLLVTPAPSLAATCQVNSINVSQYPFDRPGEMALIKGDEYLLAVDGGARNIKIIDTALQIVTDQILLDFEPARLLPSNHGKTVYVTAMFDPIVVEIDISERVPEQWQVTQWAMGTEADFSSPGAMALSQDEKFLYVADTASAAVHVIDLSQPLTDSAVRASTATLRDDFHRCTQPSDLIIGDTHLFVSCETGNTVSVFDISGPHATFSRNIPVGKYPLDMELSRDGKNLYVANSGDGSISIIDTALLTETKRVSNANILTVPVALVLSGESSDSIVPGGESPGSTLYIADRSRGALVTFNTEIEDFELGTCTINGQRPQDITFHSAREIFHVSHANGIDYISMGGTLSAWAKTASDSSYIKVVDLLLSPEESFELDIRGGIGPFEVSGTGGLTATKKESQSRIFLVTAPGVEGYGALYIEDMTSGEILTVTLRTGMGLSISPSGPVDMELGGVSGVFQASGGFPPYRWQTLKGGLSSFSARYVIYTPSVTGEDTLTVCDATGVCRETQIRVTISGVVVTPATAVMLPEEEKLFSAMGGTQYLWDAPLGGEITVVPQDTSGTSSGSNHTIRFKAPDTTGSYRVMLTETQTGETANVMVTVIHDDIEISPATAHTGRGGNLIFSATGGLSPYTWTVEQGDLSRTRGSDVAYTAPAISGEYRITVRDSGGRTVSVPVIVGSDVRISPFSPVAAMGELLSFSLSGFQGDVVWSPSDGEVIGKNDNTATWMAPHRAGTFYLLAADDRGSTAQAVIKVIGTTVKVTPSQEDVRQGDTVILKVTGGDAPYSWSAQAGSLSASQGSFVYWKAPLWQPDAPVSVTVEDSTGAPVQAKLTVTPGSPGIGVRSAMPEYSITRGDAISLDVETFMDDGWDIYLLLALPRGVLPADTMGVWFSSSGIGGITLDMAPFVPESYDKRVNQILELSLSDVVLPVGEYALYGAMVPRGNDLFDAVAAGDYLLDIVTFHVVD